MNENVPIQPIDGSVQKKLADVPITAVPVMNGIIFLGIAVSIVAFVVFSWQIISLKKAVDEINDSLERNQLIKQEEVKRGGLSDLVGGVSPTPQPDSTTPPSPKSDPSPSPKGEYISMQYDDFFTFMLPDGLEKQDELYLVSKTGGSSIRFTLAPNGGFGYHCATQTGTKEIRIDGHLSLMETFSHFSQNPDPNSVDCSDYSDSSRFILIFVPINTLAPGSDREQFLEGFFIELSYNLVEEKQALIYLEQILDTMKLNLEVRWDEMWQ